tara:strand:- start:498 stop:692 length:195 start_codon:yes stop_codon:yes gene_type:complete
MTTNNNIKEKKYVLPSSILKELFKYLMAKPYGEVATVMGALAKLTEIEETTNNVTERENKKNTR